MLVASDTARQGVPPRPILNGYCTATMSPNERNYREHWDVHGLNHLGPEGPGSASGGGFMPRQLLHDC